MEMNVYDILLAALLIVIVALAVRKIYRDKKSGKSCSCGSSGCSGNCGSCHSSCMSRHGQGKM